MHSSLSRVLQEDESLRSHVIMLEHPKLIQMNLQGETTAATAAPIQHLAQDSAATLNQRSPT